MSQQMKKTIKVFFHLLVIYFISWTMSFIIAGNSRVDYFNYLYTVFIVHDGFVGPTYTFFFSIFIFIILTIIYSVYSYIKPK
jgi:hypothetical protein